VAQYCTSLLAPRDVHKLLKHFGATASYLPAALIVLVLVLQHFFHKYPWRIQGKVLAGMLAESILWMVPMICMARFSGRLLSQQAQAATHYPKALQGLLEAAGAGIYEEFLFRLGFISVVMLILVDILGLKKEPSAGVAVILGAAVFSLYHFSTDQLADLSTMPWPELIFRAVAGMYLGCVYVCRGFGIAVGTHTFYNVFVLVSTL
jgi:hypothetical protein